MKIKHRIIKLPFFKEFKKCALISIPSPLLKKGKDWEDNIKNIWVPNRNSLFINLAACFAEYYNVDWIITGFNREEAQEFPDNTKEFVEVINKTLVLSTLKTIRVKSFVANYTKREIYQIGLEINAPLQHIYSCYLGGKKMCGRCMSCKRLIEAKQE